MKCASGTFQGNLHLKTCFQSRSFGVAERDPPCQAKEALPALRTLRYNNPIYADVAQLIERFLAKEEATSLSLVIRTKHILEHDLCKTSSKSAFFAFTQTRTLTNFFDMM